jgi:hypothetical protein
MYPKTLLYSFLLTGKKTNNTVEWDVDPATLDKILLGIPLHIPLNDYNSRSRIYSGFNIGYDDSMSFIEGSLDLVKSSLKELVFEVEMAVVPSKLETGRREAMESLLIEFKGDKRFKVGWEDSMTGIKKRTDKAMKRLLKQLRGIPHYKGEDDLKMEDIAVTVPEALSFLGLNEDAKKKDVVKTYKVSYRELARKLHPDSDEGDEDSFMFLQKCKSALDSWTKK